MAAVGIGPPPAAATVEPSQRADVVRGYGRRVTRSISTPRRLSMQSNPQARPVRATRGRHAAPVAEGGAVVDASRDERIRAAAYALYEARGCDGGHEMEDWLAAEARIDGRTAEPH
jgi:hypothetical protein